MQFSETHVFPAPSCRRGTDTVFIQTVDSKLFVSPSNPRLLGSWDDYALSPATKITRRLDEKSPELLLADPAFGSLALGFASPADAALWEFKLRVAAAHRPGVTPNLFRTIATLGSDPLGSAAVVEHLPSQSVYCLRTIEKGALTTAVLPYLAPLIAAENPFAASVCAAFTTPGRYHVCTPYPMCGPLVNAEFASAADLRLAAAELACAIDRFHRAGLILHGLTPDHVLVDADGHIVIAELGVGARPSANSPYVAPEVPERGFTEAADWWSFGALLYAVLWDGADEDAESLVSSLLSADRKRRARFETIKTHRFFAGVDWDAVAEKRAGAPRLGVESDGADEESWNNTETVLG
jgi:hypothetical protein